MHKPTTEILDQAVVLRAAQISQRDIMAQTGLNLSQLERHFWAIDLELGLISGGFIAQPDSLTAKAAIIAGLRLNGESWGLISVRFREPESRTRKHFKEASGLDSKGMRIGKGGRYVADEIRFYQGADRAKLGSELKPGPKLVQLPVNPDEAPTRLLPSVAGTVSPEASAKALKAAKAKAKREVAKHAKLNG